MGNVDFRVNCSVKKCDFRVENLCLVWELVYDVQVVFYVALVCVSLALGARVRKCMGLNVGEN